jgi:hypothetical protein
MRRIFHLAAAVLGSLRCGYCTLVGLNFSNDYQGLWDYRHRMWQVVLMQMPILLLLFMFSLVFFFWYQKMNDINAKVFSTNNHAVPAPKGSKMKYIIITFNASIACMLIVVWLFMMRFANQREFLLNTVHGIQGFFALVWAVCFGWISLRQIPNITSKIRMVPETKRHLKILSAVCTTCCTCFASRALLLLLEIWIVELSDNVNASVL